MIENSLKFDENACAAVCAVPTNYSTDVDTSSDADLLSLISSVE